MEPNSDAGSTGATGAPAMGSQSKYAKAEDWGKYRNTISALFMCHSLPNVMRIMRDDFQFHATPKMYQVHIYQKWGLRKGRPESTKKKKKRRRDADSDGEDASVASSSRVAPSFPEPAPGGFGDEFDDFVHDVPPASQAPDMHWASHQPGGMPPHMVPPQSDMDQMHAALPYHQADNSDHSNPYQQPLIAHPEPSTSSTQLSKAVVQVPFGWEEFLSLAQPMAMPPNGKPDHLNNQFRGSRPQPAGQQHLSYAETIDPSTGSWMSTVLENTPPSSEASSSRRTPSSTRGRSSDKSTKTHKSSKSSKSSKSRTSNASSSRETLLSSRESDLQSERSSGRSSHSSRMTLPSASLRYIQAPDGLLRPEKSMFFARHYISSTFSTGLWTLSQTTDPSLLDTECVRLDRWFNNFNPGQDFLFDGRVKAAFRIFQRCFASTKDIIEPQDPRVVIYIAQQAIRFLFYDRLGRNLSQTLLKYATGLCRELFTIHHPLYIIMAQLSQMDNFEFAHNIRSLMDCYFDHLEPFLDQGSNAYGFINDLRGLTISLMEATGIMGIYEAKPCLDKLCKRAEANGHSILQLKIETGAMLQRARFFDQALPMLMEYTYAGVMLGVTLRKMKRLDECITLGYEMAEYLANPPVATGSGFNDELFESQISSSLVMILGKLEKDLRDSGRIEEANQIQARLNSSITIQYGAGVESTPDPTAEPGEVLDARGQAQANYTQ
ncbi:Clr5 domain-containing protein [Apiospora arundinis]